MAGPWEQYAPAAAPPAADGPWSQYAAPAQDDLPYAVVPPADPAPRQAPADPRRSGYIANTGAAAVEGGSGFINTLFDPIGNMIGKPLAILGTTAHDALASTFGYEKFTPEQRAFFLNDQVPQAATRAANAVGAVMGAPSPDEIVPATPGEAAVRAGVGAGIGMAGLGVAGAAPGAVGRALATGGALGASGGVVGEAATAFVPDEYKPVASLIGNVVGAGVPAVGAGLVRGGLNSLADFAAPAIGRQNPLMDGATPFITTHGEPVAATTRQARLAGEQLQAAASDPAAVRATLDNPPAPAVPGAEPTTAQLTRDPGLAMQEYRVSRSGTPLEQAAFRGRADAQNDARVGVLRGVADGADPAAVPQALQRQAADVDAEGSARVQGVQSDVDAQLVRARAHADRTIARLRGQAAQGADAIGGNFPAGSESAVGAALRAPIEAQRGQEAAAASRLYDAVAPDGNLALSVAPYKGAAADLAREATPSSADPPALRARLMQRLANMPDVVPYNEARDIQQQLSQGMREAKMTGDLAEHRRLSILRSGLERSLSEAAAEPAAPAGQAAQPAPPPVSSAAAPNVGDNVYTSSGQRIGVRYELADARDLVTSHGADMSPNPAFPAELQPRQRDRAASALQVQNIASRLEPERLGASSTATDGAPIVAPDNVVESGNGRVMALRQAHEANGPQAQSYRDWLANQGHDATGMRQPVLIRRRTSDMTPEQRVAFAADANSSGTMALSGAEQAAIDARRLTPDVLGAHQGGDVTDTANRDFVRSFARNVVDPSQTNAFAGADGSVSRAGADRARAALTHRAYGDAGLTATLAETTDPAAKVLAGAMRDAAGPMAQLRVGIERGHVDPAMDLAPALVEATSVVQRARASGLSLADTMAQRDAFNQVSPEAATILRAAYGENLAGRMSQAKMATLLEHYATEAQQQQASAGLFDDRVTSSQVLDGVVARYGKDAAQEAASGTTGRAGPSDGPNGYRASGSRPDAAGPQAPGGSRGDQNVLPAAAPPELTANFDADAAARLRAANAKYAENVERFRNAPGVGQALQGGPTSGTFRTPDSAVPNIIVRTGPAGADVARAYVQAGGSVEGLSEAAAFSLRREAMRPDGTLDPGKYLSWAKQRSSFLSQIPDAASRFGSAVEAQRAVETGTTASAQALKEAVARAEQTVNDAVVARAAANRALQDSAIGKFLGDADPVARVGSILRDKANGRAQMAQLAQAVRGNPEATAGLQRAVAEHIQRDLIGNSKGVASEESYIRNDRFQTFLKQSEPALREIMTPEQMQALRNVSTSLEQSNLSSQVGVGSPTAQLTAGRGATLLGRLGQELAGATTGASVGAGIGSLIGSAPGAMVGGAIGGALGKAVQAAREAGIQNIEHLKTEALLNPALFKLLMSKVTPKNEATLLNATAVRLRQSSMVGAIQATSDRQDDRRQPSAGLGYKPNPLASVAFSAGTLPVQQNTLLQP